MPEPHYRIQYHATFEERIDIAILSTQRLQTHARAKQTGRRNVALLLPAVATFTAATKRDDFLVGARSGMIALGSVALLGLPIYFLNPFYYNWCVRKICERMTRERWGDSGIASATEFRGEKLWTEQAGIETARPWSSLTEIENLRDDIRPWFTHTVVTFPRRAFKDDGDREAMIQTARGLARRAGANV